MSTLESLIPAEGLSGLSSELRDLRDVPLGRVAASIKSGDRTLDEPLRRFAPLDGNPLLLVSAGFNSSI